MNNYNMLKFIAGTNPIFNIDYGILSAPVRHLFMISMIWYLTKKKSDDHLQILEIGSWVGASALSFAQGLKRYNNCKGTITCIDAWTPFFDREIHNNDHYRNMEMALTTDSAYQLFLHNVSTIPKSITCQHLKGKSEKLLPLLRENTFNIVFIDGDHAYNAVSSDIKNSLSLVKDGGVICGDDLNLQLSQVDEDNVLENCEKDFIKDPKTNRNFHPGVTLAVSQIFGEVSAWGGFWAMQKRGETWYKISMQGMPIHFPEHFPEKALKDAESHLRDIDII